MARERLRRYLVVVLLPAAVVSLSAQRLADLMSEATEVGERLAFTNDYVRVSYTLLEYPDNDTRTMDSRPVLLYVSVLPGPGVANTSLLGPPRGARRVWYPGVVPVAVRIDVLAAPPRPPELGEPGTDLPRGAQEENRWEGGRLVRVTFRPLRYGAGTGPHANVTTFLSDGAVEVRHRGLRRRMGVRAGEAFWFEPGTALTVVDDYPVGAAIVQLLPSRRGPR